MITIVLESNAWLSFYLFICFSFPANWEGELQSCLQSLEPN